MVGKCLMFHPFGTASGVLPDELGSYQGPIGCSIYSHEHYETDTSRGFIRGFMMQIVRETGPLNEALGGATATRVPWGSGHHEAFTARFGRVVNMGLMGEDLPELVNEVTLDPTLTDSDGIPSPLVRYRLSENSLKMMEYAAKKATEALEAAGAQQVYIRNPLKQSGWHLLGTCRMGDDPASSVVDRWGRAHDVPNLFIVDGSTMVTSTGMNPTATIMAVALRSMRHLAETRSSIPTAF